MTLLQNVGLLGPVAPIAGSNGGNLIPHWDFECSDINSATVQREACDSDAADSLVLRLVRTGGWVRLWQKITPANVSLHIASFSAVIDAVGLTGTPGLTLDWIRLLEAGDDGRPVNIPANRDPHCEIGGDVAKIVSRILPPLANPPGRPLLLALQFSGPGSAIIRRIELVSLPGPATSKDSPATSAPLPPLALQCSGATLTGEIVVPDSEDEVLVFADGRPFATSPASVSKFRRFSISVPPELQDGKPRSISIRRINGKRAGLPTQIALGDATDGASQAGLRGATGKRICVVAWDMGHNPAGRACMLAEMAARNNSVRIVGPLFPAYGKAIWPPIATSPIPMETFPAPDFKSFVAGALEIVSRIECDVVYVSKPRLPGLFLGALIKQRNGCPLVLDIDDHELSFFNEGSSASLDEVRTALASDPAQLDKPYAALFTRYAESLISACDGVTVSNYALQDCFGGIIVRHGRDERLFDPDLHDRDKVRAEFGYGSTDRVIVFLGTPRQHKGVFELADILEEIGDDRLALCVIGSANDKRIDQRFSGYRRARISLNPYQPWTRLPELVNMADAVFLLQDAQSPVSQYQIPAKLTDALALGVQVYATPVPPLRDLIAAGAVIAIENRSDLENALRQLAKGGRDGRAAARARNYFLSELSNTANSARIETAIELAAARSRKTAPAFDRMFEALEVASGLELPRFKHRWRAPAIWSHKPPDAVFFWKQNDSDLYGRRSDMMTKYLLETGAVKRIVHFDAPISATRLRDLMDAGSQAAAHQGPHIYANTLRRFRRDADTSNLARRTFVYDDAEGDVLRQGAALPKRGRYPDFVAETLRELYVSSSPFMWVCPVIYDYPALKDAIMPSCVVADIIDDQRSLPMKDSALRKMVRAYDDILSDADVILANCESAKAGFAHLRSDIHVVPNGAEIFDLERPHIMPERLSALPGSIIGYVGNLRDRLDVELIRKVASAYPDASIVLIGSAHGDADALSLADQSNINLLGVIPYEQAAAYIRSFDVAIVPHLRNLVSERMNPLKLYVYFSLGTPIVTTDVSNIDDIGPFANVAHSHEAFIAAVGNVLRGGGVRPTRGERETILNKVSWRARVRDIAAIVGLGQASTGWNGNGGL